MAESAECKQVDINTFKEDTDSKSVEKEAINLSESDNDADSTIASITLEIEEDIANLQAQAIMEVANSLGSSVDLGTGEIKQTNLEIEAALRSTNERDSRSVRDRSSLTESQLAAYFAERTAEDCRLIIAMGEDLMETITSTIGVLKSHIGKFADKVVEASGLNTERGYSVADFYTTMVSKYEAAVAALERRILNVEVALRCLKDCVDACLKYAALADEIIDESLDQSRKTIFAACWWNNKGKATIVVALMKERAALLMMRRIWISVRDDMKEEELNRSVEESDEETQQCQNRDRKTKIGHIVGMLLGIALTSITCLFKVGSESFYAILVLGLLTTGWCLVYWAIKFYKFLKEKEAIFETQRPERDPFIENCERRIAIMDAHLRKYSTVMNLDMVSDTGSSGAAAIDDMFR